MDEKVLESQMMTLYDHCEDMVYFMKRKAPYLYEYVYINKASEKIFEENPIGKELSETNIPDETVEVIREKYEEACRNNQQIVYRDFYLFADSKHTNETTIWPVIQDGDMFVLVMSKEVSKRKIIEEEQHFFSTLFINQAYAMAVIDKTKKILKANPKFYESILHHSEEAIGKSIGIAFQYTKVQQHLFEEKLSWIEDGSEVEYMPFTDQYEGETRYTLAMKPIRMGDETVAISLEWLPYSDKAYFEAKLKEKNFELDGYRQALASATCFCITDPEGVIKYVSDGYEEITGYTNSELIGKTNRILNSRQHPKSFYKDLWDTIKRGEIWKGEICNRNKRGYHYWALTSIVPIFDEHDEIKNFVSVCVDITERQSLLASLQSIERTFKLITENTNDFMTILSEDGIILYVSPNYQTKLGYKVNQLTGKFYNELLTDESSAVFEHEFAKIQSSKIDTSMELQLKTPNGENIWTEASIRGVQDPKRPAIFQFVMVAREITERKQKEEELRFLAYHDALTMLPNRRYLTLQYSLLEKEAKESNTSIVAMYIDGDNFKLINDRYGHDIGDEFIRQFGYALKKSVRDTDIVCRIGGDEFVIVLTQMSPQLDMRKRQVLATIARIQQVLRTGWFINGTHFAPTSSIGIAMTPDNGESVSLLLEKADGALYLAKNENGKDSYCFAE